MLTDGNRKVGSRNKSPECNYIGIRVARRVARNSQSSPPTSPWLCYCTWLIEKCDEDQL